MKLIAKMLRASLPAMAAAATLLAAASASAAPQQQSAPGLKPAQLQFNSCAKPVYPAAAVAEKREGTVSLAFDVTADGAVWGSRIEKSSGHTDLDETALAAISKCTFTPASQDGTPVADNAKVKYVWTLK
jgi:bla regulator protein BlaR1